MARGTSTKLPRHPTQKEKIQQYEDLLHMLQFNMEVAMRDEIVRDLLARICRWSYAHRSGNGEVDAKRKQAEIDWHFWKLDPHRKDMPTQ